MRAKCTAPFQGASTSWWPFGLLVIIQYDVPLGKAGSRDLLEQVQSKSHNNVAQCFLLGDWDDSFKNHVYEPS